MKLEQLHIEEIKARFGKMVFKEDLLDLLNYVKPFIYGEKAVPFELKQLTYYANPAVPHGRYVEFTVKKKSGGIRTIHAPNKGLKAIQKCLSLIVQSVYTPHKAAFGFVQDKSIVDNARVHAGNFYVYNIDLKDFFPSIDQARVWKVLQLPPFNLVKGVADERMVIKYKPGTYSPTIELGEPLVSVPEEFLKKLAQIKEDSDVIVGQDHEHSEQFTNKTELVQQQSCRLDLANIIAALCCTEMEVERHANDGTWEKVKRNVLPQGAPTSPIITNIICQRLDFLLSAVARRFGCRYTRYADDITFSSIHNIYQEGGEFIQELRRVIQDQGFHIKSKKTRLQKVGYRQEVTGLVVNDKVNVHRRYIKQLRKWLYLWETYGYEKAQALFVNDYVKDKGHVKQHTPKLENVVEGKLNYLRMVKGTDDTTFISLMNRFKNLTNPPNQESGYDKYVFEKLEVASPTEVNHRPSDTVSFLKYFKYDNEYSFKELVHIPVEEENFDYLTLLKEANQQFLQITKSHDGKVNLPKKLVENVQSFFDILSTLGLEFFQATGKHPLDDKKVGSVIQGFKKNYRFGNERSESSILSDLIINIAKKRAFNDQENDIIYSFGDTDTSNLFKIDQLTFFPDLRRFQAKANFFTWVPSIKLALSHIFDSILKHSNVNSKKSFTSLEKKIVIQLNRILDGDTTKIELSIQDKDSLFLGEVNNILKDMRRDFLGMLKGVCDFKTQFQTVDKECYECKVLPYAEEIRLLKESVEGFKYIFTFYD